MIVQTKNQKKAADINVVGEFASVISDVGAQKGVLICNSGFTKKAKEYAKRKKIDICSAHDASKINWQTKIEVPVIKKSVTVKLVLRHIFVPLRAHEIEGVQLPDIKYALEEFLKKWENNEIPKDVGKHTFRLNKDLLKILNKDLWPISSIIDYEIFHRHHFKFFVPIDYRGIRDYVSERFTPTFMEFKEAIPFADDGTWRFVPDPKEISLKAVYLDIEIVHIDMLKLKMLKINLLSGK
jgi:hypothetical protein